MFLSCTAIFPFYVHSRLPLSASVSSPVHLIDIPNKWVSLQTGSQETKALGLSLTCYIIVAVTNLSSTHCRSCLFTPQAGQHRAFPLLPNRFTESQTIQSWKEPTRTIKSSSQLCTAQSQDHTTFLRELSKCFSNFVRLGAVTLSLGILFQCPNTPWVSGLQMGTVVLFQHLTTTVPQKTMSILIDLFPVFCFWQHLALGSFRFKLLMILFRL